MSVNDRGSPEFPQWVERSPQVPFVSRDRKYRCAWRIGTNKTALSGACRGQGKPGLHSGAAERAGTRGNGHSGRDF